MKPESYMSKELTKVEEMQIDGGNPIVIFIAGAIIGGALYDAYKAACKAAINAQVNHPEYYDGAVHSQR
jgi:hypothetical protein